MNTFLDTPEVWKCSMKALERTLKTTGEIEKIHGRLVKIYCTPVSLVIPEEYVSKGWYEMEIETYGGRFFFLADPGLKLIYEYLS